MKTNGDNVIFPARARRRGELYFLPYQAAWLADQSQLKLMEKSRQIGMSFTDAYDSVRKVCVEGARLDVWVSSRDEAQAKLYLEDCRKWAALLQVPCHALEQTVIDRRQKASAYALRFSTGRTIYSLSSNPNALAGKRGHVKLDEFALHQDQRLLYRVAKPVTMWGGQLCVISTHRGAGTVFNELVKSVRERGNPMGWSLHSVPLQRAVTEGLAERINARTGREETRAQFMARLRAECIDEEQWLQEYCCVPADEAAAFISWEMLRGCEAPELRLWTVDELCAASASAPDSVFYAGLDVARRNDLCVLDVGERIGDVVWDRARLDLQGRSFSELESELYRLLKLRTLKRVCIDATGMGLQLAERAGERFGWKVEPITFTPMVKEELAFGLRVDFLEGRLRVPRDEALQADLRGVRKEVTAAGNIRFTGDTGQSHCDRFWAKALRQHAARMKTRVSAAVA